jgi:hypothetical protein
MSLNLYIEVDGEELEVYQTPTSITKMCLAPDRKGRISKHRAVNAYFEYVRGLSDGVYESAEDIKEHRQTLEDHIAEVQAAIKNCEKFEVYVV